MESHVPKIIIKANSIPDITVQNNNYKITNNNNITASTSISAADLTSITSVNKNETQEILTSENSKQLVLETH